jgi:hypothetical protein
MYTRFPRTHARTHARTHTNDMSRSGEPVEKGFMNEEHDKHTIAWRLVPQGREEG